MTKSLTYSFILVAILAFQLSAGYRLHSPHYSNIPIFRTNRIHLKWMDVSFLFFIVHYIMIYVIHLGNGD